MLKVGTSILSSNGDVIALNKYYINFLGKFIGTILASNEKKATVKAQRYFFGKEIEMEDGYVKVDNSTVGYIITMEELEYKELSLPIEDILEVFENKQ